MLKKLLDELQALEKKKVTDETLGEIETEHHEYQLYLALEDIDHSKTKAHSL
ncbi:MAG: hypothetical protein K6U80_07860 [Firmicutes bacterium]|nr:hypothetical protein [Bacillota bacterium]